MAKARRAAERVARIAAWLAINAAFAAGCGEQSSGSSGETHFLSCHTDADCTPLGQSYRCQAGECRLSASTPGIADTDGGKSESGLLDASGGNRDSGLLDVTGGDAGARDGGVRDASSSSEAPDSGLTDAYSALDAPYMEPVDAASTLAACEASGQALRASWTESSFRDALVRSWVLCDTVSIFGTSEAGLQMLADNRWYKLYMTNGALVHGSGPDDSGSWEMTATTDGAGNLTFAVNLLLSGGRFVPTLPQFTILPDKMHLTSTGTPATYVALGEATTAVPEPDILVSYPPAACTADGGTPTAPATLDAFRTLLVGRWLTCSGSAFGTTDEVGVEITADGAWYKLYPGSVPGATVVRGHGFEREGSWGIQGGTAGTLLQVDFAIWGDGTAHDHATFTTDPRQMHLAGLPANGDYAIDP